VSDPHDPALLPDGLDLPAAEWQQSPLSMRLLVLTLRKRMETLETRLHQNSANSSRPPSTARYVVSADHCLLMAYQEPKYDYCSIWCVCYRQ
jgi:hypothetical protein